MVSIYKWFKRYIRPEGAMDYVVVLPWETTPYMLLGEGIPTAKTFDPVSRVNQPDAYPLGYTQSGLGGMQQSGQIVLQPLAGGGKGL